MARRYSDIKRGAELNQALGNYITYLQTPRPRNINSRGAQGTTKTVYGAPFNIEFEVDVVYASRVNPDHFTALSTYINQAGSGAQVLEAPGANSIGNAYRYRLPRVIWFRNTTRTVSVVTSDITGLRRLSYAGDRFSCPFGANADSDDQATTFNQIKSNILGATAGTYEVNRVSLSKEVFSAAS